MRIRGRKVQMRKRRGRTELHEVDGVAVVYVLYKGLGALCSFTLAHPNGKVFARRHEVVLVK
jgi:hypothetical protein